MILTARLIRKSDDESDDQPAPKESDLTGTLVSSLYSLKDTDNTQGGFFVFGDLSVRKVGMFRLAFVLYELKLAEKECWLLSRTVSDPFIVYATKTFPGLAESTFLTRSFSDQGVRLRLRKDSRTVSTKKRSIGMAAQAEQIRASQGIHGYHLPHDASHDLGTNGHSSHHMRRLGGLQDPSMASGQLDRSRHPLGPQGGYYGDSPMRGGEFGSGAYGYAGYDEKPTKRARMDGTDDAHHHVYETDYHPYAAHAAGPRTVPDSLASLYPMSTSYPVPAMTGLSMPPPSPFAAMPRLDTQIAPPQHSPTPNSATSTNTTTTTSATTATAATTPTAASAFSPGAAATRRSPGSAYPYPPQHHHHPHHHHQPPLPPTTAMFAAAAAAAPSSLPYHPAGPAAPQLPGQPNGLGIALPAGAALDMEALGRQA